MSSSRFPGRGVMCLFCASSHGGLFWDIRFPFRSTSLNHRSVFAVFDTPYARDDVGWSLASNREPRYKLHKTFEIRSALGNAFFPFSSSLYLTCIFFGFSFNSNSISFSLSTAPIRRAIPAPAHGTGQPAQMVGPVDDMSARTVINVLDRMLDVGGGDAAGEGLEVEMKACFILCKSV